MWCNNCLLIFPLRGGAMALAALIAAYSLAGAICLFLWGQYLWFGPYEYQVYGGISIAVMVCSLLLIVAFTNYSIIWTSALAFMLPFVSVISIVRAGLMIFRLDSFEENVVWECNNNRMLYNATIAADPVLLASYDSSQMPAAVCSRPLPPLPHPHVAIDFAAGCAVDAAARPASSEEQIKSRNAPPPPYHSPHPANSVNPLTFFSFPPETTSSPLPAAQGSALPSRLSQASLSPPPSYAETPRTQAERLFLLGWLFPPFLWIIGASRLWRTEAPHGLDFKKKVHDLFFSASIAEEAGMDVRESLERWREEELVWARRCLCALVGSLMLGTLLGVMLASVTGKI
ncbi:hypothetical protein JCM10908_001040 [Rhodotorula pacifica]|uniref:uncharacterized protein n=1 Tax=Rhodotorula pacifica TaxID=1495444 RepID=UPI003173A89C